MGLELVVKDNDAAIAGELAFCLWIRRRDPHAWNRVYVDGVPMFFDQHVAFDTRSVDDFFEPGNDGSYPSRWRVRSFASDDFVPTTQGERDAARQVAHEIGLHRVRNLESFKREVDAAIDHIAHFDLAWVADQVKQSDAPGGLFAFLEQTHGEMASAASRLLTVLFRSESGNLTCGGRLFGMNLQEQFDAHDAAQAAATAAFIEMAGRPPRRGDRFDLGRQHLFYVGDGYRWHMVRDDDQTA